jgi:hypothetical protein
VRHGRAALLLPLLLFLGLPLPATVALTALGSLVQRLFSVYHLRESIPGKSLIPLIAAGLLALPLGVMLLQKLSSPDATCNPNAIQYGLGPDQQTLAPPPVSASSTSVSSTRNSSSSASQSSSAGSRDDLEQRTTGTPTHLDKTLGGGQ